MNATAEEAGTQGRSFHASLISHMCVRRAGAGLASDRGSETGGHTHSTRTHQQVQVMGAILGLKVRHEVMGRGGGQGTNRQGTTRKPWGGRERRGRGRQGYERSLLIDMPDITITLLI